MRWGDKVASSEGVRINASDYAAALAPLVARANATSVWLATSSPVAVAEMRAALADSPAAVVVPKFARVPEGQIVADPRARGSRAFNFMPAGRVSRARSSLEMLCDVFAVLRARAAVVTFSSSIGRYVFYHNYRRIGDAHFELVSLDASCSRWWFPNPGFA